MLSETQKNKLCERFLLLSRLERQLIALKILCSQYPSETAFTTALRQAGISDEAYQSFLKNLPQLGFSEQKKSDTIYLALHHAFLIRMSDEDMVWVYALARPLYEKLVAYSYDTQRLKAQALLRIALYANELPLFSVNEQALSVCNKLVLDLQDIFNEYPVNIDWLQSRHAGIRGYVFVALLGNYYCDLSPVINSREILASFEQCAVHLPDHDFLNYYSAIIHLSLGQVARTVEYSSQIKDPKSGFLLALQASIAFLEMQFEQASKLFRKALTAQRKQSGVPAFYFDNIVGIFHGFCLAFVDKNYTQLTTNATNYAKYFDANWSMSMNCIYGLFPIVGMVEGGDQQGAQHALQSLRKETNSLKNPLLIAVYALIGYMTNKEFIQKNHGVFYQVLHTSIESHQGLAVPVFYELFSQLVRCQVEANAFLDTSPIRLRLLELIHVKDNWEYSFQALEGLLIDTAKGMNIPASSKRLMWLIDPIRQRVDVIEQSMGKSGKWSCGRSISLEKLKHHHMDTRFEYLSTHDKRVINGIMEESDGWRGSYYSFEPYPTLLALVGHPHVAHHDNRNVAIELVLGEPELHIEENKQGFHLSLSHFLSEPGLIVEPESLNKYTLIDISSAFVSIGRVLTPKGLSVPTAAKDKILSVIQHAKRDIKIHVDIKDIDIPEIAGDSAPCIQLLPVKEGVKATLWVKPQANQGAYFKIAEGKETFMTLVSEQGTDVRTRIHRDFSAEKSHQKKLLKACPSLSHHEYDIGEYEIESPEDVLEILSELQHYASAEPLTIEWPQGQSFKIKQRVSAMDMALKITSDHNWFGYDGSMTLHDGEVLGMQELLESLDTRAFGRFVRLGNGEFIELTSQLKKQLHLLHALSDNQKINPLGAQVLSDIVAQVENTTFDAGWTAHLKKIKTMRLHAPKVPSTLQATLRDYQIEGFQYLSRLTHWGIGACLADDMGLGKTVQTIALLLERAKQGPSLVVAPTSVCFNWMEELNKFAPTLTVYDLRTQARAALVEKATSFDVVICSYGLLQHNESLLAEKQWETIVLDEAQAIKNAHTQRWKTVMKLKGKSRIALSGTPIENHLGELWSIFSFINPGLLGAVKSFQTKYSIPIETNQAPDKIHALRALVQPYILRRIKSEVLTELPPKTEQTIHVEQTEEEATFYEALRRTAEERMAHFMAENNRISVLAEITKLRQACCDSSLVDASVVIENSKLNAFIETLKNIIENGHKALVFSQYVSFLTIVRKRMADENIVYQYLDGSTSPANRKKSVDAFQSGEGDVFLLSLKAGGSGLNLTAADYVIHLDPWWNPAVEDQASDRAHRIGQERPVTIYRFVMRNTIEEKIIGLHEHKRNLANELLSGHGISGKLSNDDLMNLISNSHGL